MRSASAASFGTQDNRYPLGRSLRRSAWCGTIVALSWVCCVSASADDHGTTLQWQAELGTLALDERLADFGWETTFAPTVGIEAAANWSLVTLGLRSWTTGSIDTTPIPDSDATPDARLSAVELVGRARITSVFGFHTFAHASAGVVRVGYSPDQITIAPVGVTPIEVGFDSVNERISSLGLGIQRALDKNWELRTGVERRWFALDTAHRAGNVIVEDRETFAQWAVTFAVAHRTFHL